ncbi:hypothetical protein HN51_048080 [Arachis hypogaea]|uniref:TIR domain-containing protein n=1 Tax=Arachis hypogaea TaxID=3818 RepID=A0A445AJP3_ARAHY|nr:putative disease resistance RPP13-like protein 3 [Arachis ipaensis]XP_025633525.1 putative disease resistance RPP13-like protein 3 [Arachis hypogaea]QHO24556.1 uncharacterized protein DS421_12g373220 [Arachis hypogaea]RYR26598.1 hypothetical protein Ahy_B02g060863 [Arachis hypogaea]
MGNHSTSKTPPSLFFTYDVFLSFRGDTRYGFTDCLYHALTSKRINTFRDRDNLKTGDEIAHAVLEAIEKSRISIVVLCQNYASSTWCLDELAKIMECTDRGRRQRVLPIFYKVEPSDVRHQRNQYEAAMIKHENGRNSHKVEAWRLALTSVGNLSGQHRTADMYESNIIDKIVEEVLRNLPPQPLLFQNHVEFDSQLEDVKSLLDVESSDTLCMLGIIYGDGETMSKTRFIVELYNKIMHQFEAASFLANVGEKSKESVSGLEDLQKTILIEMDEEATIMIGSTFKGSAEIKQKLGHKRVLLVLDDVDNVQQLHALVGGGDWFGLGSRIIVTTRDEKLVNKHELNGVEIKKYRIGTGEFESMELAKPNHRQRDTEEGDVIIGFQNNVSTIINQLKENYLPTNVVSIIGMGGLGKTTIARKIYNGSEVKKLFSCRAWSTVSKSYVAREVLLSLLRCLKKVKKPMFEFKNSSEEEIRDELREYLKKQKYLVVLDDLWDPLVWDDIKRALPSGKTGSRILITSRNNEVANYTSPVPPHYLPFLNNEESWELFCKKVFWGGECPSDLESIGKSMVENCGGLPIAIITLAGLVSKKKRSQREWLRIKGHVNWHLAQDNSKVKDALKLSFDDLPARLKPCFLYFGLFPEDYTISARKLVQLWMAEGFVRQEECGIPYAPQPEDIGDEYLDELVDRCLVQVTKRRSDGGVKYCQIHDLLHDFCISTSKVDKFLEICTESNIHSLRNPRRLSLLGKAQSTYNISSMQCDESCTSLFIFATNEHIDDNLKNFQSIHVLHLAKGVFTKSTPSDLKVMINLKYLRIERSTSCYYEAIDIPDCIWSLCNLETLDLRDLDTHTTSNRIWNLKRLRHVYMLLTVELPSNGAKTSSLNLQTLCEVVLDQQLTLALKNGWLPKLKKLGLRLNQEYTPHEYFLSLLCLSNLSTLHVECIDSNYLHAAAFPSNLTKVTLKLFVDENHNIINALAHLANLQVLKLIDGILPDSLNCGTTQFPQLQMFLMNEVYIKRWRLEKGAMPQLRRLVIHNCIFLKQVHVVDPSHELKTTLQMGLMADCKFVIHNSK